MENLEETISRLISLKSEGPYWDFKLVHHKEAGELLFDILCLSNSLVESDRYIIFGIEPTTYEVVGTQEPKPRTQADIISLLSTARFAGSRKPSIELLTITLGKIPIDVLIIRTMGRQPFYLEKDYIFGKKRINRGVIYSREEDRNTPIDEIAPPDIIEELWMKRLGLRDSPIGRFVKILPNYNEWRWDGITGAYYIKEPDYRLEIRENPILGAGNYWWGNILHEKPSVEELTLIYRGVDLESLITLRYYREALHIPFPEIESIQPSGDGMYYDICYYIRNSLKYALLEHLYSAYGDGVPSPLVSQEKPPIIRLPFLVFDTAEQLVKLKRWIEDNWENRPWKTDSKQDQIEYNREFSWWLFENTGNIDF